MRNLTLIENNNFIKDRAINIVDALNLLNEFIGQTFVIKYSGSAMANFELAEAFANDVISLKQLGINIVVVHGGSSKIQQILEKITENKDLSKKPTIEISEMILSGYINKQIISNISKKGGSAIGISGKDGRLIEAKRKQGSKDIKSEKVKQIQDLGFFGEVISINPDILFSFEDSELIPVISPIALGENGETLQVDADEVASNIASVIGANKLIIYTDHGNIFQGQNIQSVELVEKFIRDNKIDKNLKKNIEYGIKAIRNETEVVHIIDGRVPHALLLELLTKDRLGSMICY